MIEAHSGRIGDRASYLDYGYFGIIGCEFDEEGIASGNYYEKPAYFAYSALVSLLHSARPAEISYSRPCLESLLVNGYDCTDDSIRIEGFELEGGRRALVYWNSVDLLTTTYEGTISLEICEKLDTVRLIDLKDGGIYAIPEEMYESFGEGIRLKNLPLTDSPLAIVFNSKEI